MRVEEEVTCRCGRGDAHLDDVARGVGIGGIARVGRAVVVGARGRLVFAERIAARGIGHVRRDVGERDVVG